MADSANPISSGGGRRDWAARTPDEPREGYFRTTLTKGGPTVPARVRCFLGAWSVAINGEHLRSDPDAHKAPRVMETLNYGEEITAGEYARLLANPPALNGVPLDPRRPVDLNHLPSIF